MQKLLDEHRSKSDLLKELKEVEVIVSAHRFDLYHKNVDFLLFNNTLRKVGAIGKAL